MLEWGYFCLFITLVTAMIACGDAKSTTTFIGKILFYLSVVAFICILIIHYMDVKTDKSSTMIVLKGSMIH